MTSASGLVSISPYYPPIPQKDMSAMLRTASEVSKTVIEGQQKLRLSLYKSFLDYQLRGEVTPREKVFELASSIRRLNPALAERYASYSGWVLRAQEGGFSLQPMQRASAPLQYPVLPAAPNPPSVEAPVPHPPEPTAARSEFPYPREWLERAPHPPGFQQARYFRLAERADSLDSQEHPPLLEPPPMLPPGRFESEMYRKHILALFGPTAKVAAALRQSFSYPREFEQWMLRGNRIIDKDSMLVRLESLRQLDQESTFDAWMNYARPYALCLGWDVVPIVPFPQYDIPYELKKVESLLETYRLLGTP